MIYVPAVCVVWNGLILEKLCGIDVSRYQMRKFEGWPPDIITGYLIL